jgi:hypothetical protein
VGLVTIRYNIGQWEQSEMDFENPNPHCLRLVSDKIKEPTAAWLIAKCVPAGGHA